MKIVKDVIQKLSFEELTWFETVARHESMASAARELGMNAPMMSKAIHKMEKQLKAKLFLRTPQGVSLTREGSELVILCKRIDETLAISSLFQSPAERSPPTILGVAGASFLLNYLVAPHFASLYRNQNISLRLIDAGDSEMTGPLYRGLFEAAVHCDELQWTKVWKSYPVGTLSWVLASRRGHPLGGVANEKQVLGFPFVVPLVLGKDGARFGEDFCPVPAKQRRRFSEVKTSELGLRMIEHTDALIFLPEIQVSTAMNEGRLQRIQVKEWAPIRKTVYLTIHQDQVTQKQVQEWIKTLSRGLRD